MSSLSDYLAAYLATDYWALSAPGGPFVIRVGQFSERLASHFRSQEVASALFITAYNPFSIPTPAGENELGQARLRSRLGNLTPVVWIGEGRGRIGDWPPEPSFLALGIDYDTACAFGREFGQNAIIFTGADVVPSLVMLRGGA